MKGKFCYAICLIMVYTILLSAHSTVFADDTHIVINEIMYNPSDSQGSDAYYEYIELVNIGPVPVDINGWQISDTAETDVITAYHTGSPTLIPSGGYAIVTDNSTSVIPESGIHLAVDDASIGNGMGNTGDTLIISNGTSDIDTVTYASENGANGNGSSLECLDPTIDNSLTSNGNWGDSVPSNDFGTPGIPNSIYSGPVMPVPEAHIAVLFLIGIFSIVSLFAFTRKSCLLFRES